jgi:hypothetical protein
MIETNEATLSDVENYIKTAGKRGELSMRQLGKIAGFLEVWNSEDGQKLLQMDVADIFTLEDKMWENPLTLDEYAYLKSLRKHIVKIVSLKQQKEGIIKEIQKTNGKGD